MVAAQAQDLVWVAGSAFLVFLLPTAVLVQGQTSDLARAVASVAAALVLIPVLEAAQVLKTTFPASLLPLRDLDQVSDLELVRAALVLDQDSVLASKGLEAVWDADMILPSSQVSPACLLPLEELVLV